MKVNHKHMQKLRTRTTIIQAALELMGEEKGLEGLSLREVTRVAEISPTAFYRHFRDMDELGMVLVDEVGLKLRGLLRNARKDGVSYKVALRDSINIFFGYVLQNRALFRFIIRERVGGNSKIRSAIRQEMGYFAKDLAGDMATLKRMTWLTHQELIQLSEMIIQTSFSNANDFLDIDVSKKEEIRDIKFKAIRQLRLIYSGAALKIQKRRRIKIREIKKR